MSYEVIKTIGTGKYRYEVERIPDPESGKTRSKWRYLGKLAGGEAPKRRARADQTRDKLTAALERLLERNDWTAITAHDIAVEAGVAPATLYRYFTSRNDVLLKCASRANEQLDARLAELHNIADGIPREQERLHAWTASMVTQTPSSAVHFALWSTGIAQDLSRERNEHRRTAFHAYLRRLSLLRYIDISENDCERMAIALALIVQAFSYRAVLGRTQLRDEESSALADAVVRLVFGA